jgi:hypothetical protein
MRDGIILISDQTSNFWKGQEFLGHHSIHASPILIQPIFSWVPGTNSLEVK